MYTYEEDFPKELRVGEKYADHIVLAWYFSRHIYNNLKRLCK